MSTKVHIFGFPHHCFNIVTHGELENEKLKYQVALNPKAQEL
jgi:hypothetical protein